MEEEEKRVEGMFTQARKAGVDMDALGVQMAERRLNWRQPIKARCRSPNLRRLRPPKSDRDAVTDPDGLIPHEVVRLLISVTVFCWGCRLASPGEPRWKLLAVVLGMAPRSSAWACIPVHPRKSA